MVIISHVKMFYIDDAKKNKSCFNKSKKFSSDGWIYHLESLSVTFSIISYKIVFISVINLDLCNSTKVKNAFFQLNQFCKCQDSCPFPTAFLKKKAVPNWPYKFLV